MKKSKNVKPSKAAVSADLKGEGKLQSSPNQKMQGVVKNKFLIAWFLVMMAINGMGTDESGKQQNRKTAKSKTPKTKVNKGVVKGKPTKLTKKQKAAINKETRVKRLALTTLPTPPYVSIIPAPQLWKLNAAKLCIYVGDKFPRISAIPEMAACVPTVAFVEAIYTALLPLASKNRKDVTSAERTLIKTYKLQLTQNFMTMINSCATLANGNLPLFALTGVAVKSRGVRHDGQLPATVFRLNTKKGRGKVGVSCDTIKYAKNYTIYYGPGDYDPATWKTKTGSSRQVISGLPLGEYINFVMVANGSGEEGEWAPMQGVNVPFN